jgi:hypothetical protein
MLRRSSVTYPASYRRDSLTKTLDGIRRVLIVSYRVPAPQDISKRGIPFRSLYLTYEQ